MALNAYVNIVLVKVYLTAAFNIRCPDPLERYYRSMTFCTDASNYTCLFDEDQMSYNESCSVKLDFQRPGYMVTLRTNLNGVHCPDDLYQPLIFFSNESSNCEFKKSFCSNEGQLLSRNGTIKTDRQCRCNYVEGYTFVTNPTDACSCVPAVEDCSCYRKQCSKNHILSSDYQCIHKFTSSENFTCSSIPDLRQDMITVVYEIKISNVTVFKGHTAKECQTPTPTASVTEVNNNDDQSDSSESESGNETDIGDHVDHSEIPPSQSILQPTDAITETSTDIRIGDKKLTRTEHAEQGNIKDLPAETDIIKNAIEKLAATNCVLLWGKSGCGKTTTLCKIADYYKKNLRYRLITCHTPSDISAQQCVTEKRIFVIDDIFGRFVFSYEKFLRLKELEELFKKILEENTVKLLMTCSSVAFRTDYVQEFGLFTDNTFELTETSLLLNNKDMDSSEIKNKVEQLRKSNYEAWCCLFICILKQGCIDEADLTSDDDNMFNKFIGNVCNKLNIGISGQQFTWFRKNLCSLIGTFIKKDNRLFSITQTSVFEVLAVYFGQELQQVLIQFVDPEIITQHCCLTSCPDFDGNGMFRIQVNEENEDLYFLRIKELLRLKYLSEVFSVQQMASELYRKKLEVFLKSLGPDDLNKINNSTCRIRSETALTLISKYVKLSKILFEAKN
ncbi:unnamed protein product [Mytilus coruscus]|uniref:Novel STAND NTPase 3 domain-containing protein n=1 Tax=Mytilus coruscus TaxID=42192 RepID=A0A6J8AQB8_MYTCO|nr:unnamed protein product [Mytilus coruscus]